MRRISLILLAIITAITPAWAVQPEKVLDAPWQEALISVRAFDPIYTFLTETGGYEEVARGAVDKSQLAYWQLGEKAAARFVLLKAAGSDHGYIRLIDFDGVKQQPIRVGARAWDTGGYFSLMMRGKDLDRIFDAAIALGFQAESEPIRFVFEPTDGSPPSDLKNVVIKAPDGINFAIYERLSPALAPFWDFERLSQPFNAMQMIASTEQAEAFFQGVLGMTTFWASDFVDPEPAYNNFGLPQNLTTQIPRRTRILWPRPGETGRLEAMEIVGLKGRDLSDRATPPNLGILSVSYPVEDAAQSLAAIENAGAKPVYGLRSFSWAPYGKVRMFTVQSPGGALINIFERQE